MPFSRAIQDNLLDWVKGSAFPAAPTNLYISLHNGDPGENGAASDVTATITGIANRPLLLQANLGPNGSVSPAGREAANTALITITSSAVNASSLFVSHIALWSTITGAGCLYQDAQSTVTEVSLGDLVKFDIGAFVIRVI